MFGKLKVTAWKDEVGAGKVLFRSLRSTAFNLRGLSMLSKLYALSLVQGSGVNLINHSQSLFLGLDNSA
jgi:hypothetical protein